MRDVYLYYDPISSGYIGILPEGPLVILVEVFDTLKLVWLKVVLPLSSSTSNSWACFYNIDIHTCATNHVEKNTMKKEIARLTQLLQEEASPNEQAWKINLVSGVGDFERYTKGFGSKYMCKFGVEKGKGLGRNEQGIPQYIPYVKNNKTTTLGANGGLGNMTTPIRKGEGKTQGASHVKFVKRGTTCDEGAKIVASSSKQDKFKASSNFKT